MKGFREGDARRFDGESLSNPAAGRSLHVTGHRYCIPCPSILSSCGTNHATPSLSLPLPAPSATVCDPIGGKRDMKRDRKSHQGTIDRPGVVVGWLLDGCWMRRNARVLATFSNKSNFIRNKSKDNCANHHHNRNKRYKGLVLRHYLTTR